MNTLHHIQTLLASPIQPARDNSRAKQSEQASYLKLLSRVLEEPVEVVASRIARGRNEAGLDS